MKLKNKSQGVILTIIFLFLCIIAIYVCVKNSNVKDVILTLTALIGSFAIFYQMKRAKDLATGEFILNLQQEFSSDANHSKLFMTCWLEIEKNQDEIVTQTYTENEYIDYRKDILNYLTFFESMYIMVEENVLNIKMLDELFARRFFTIVNNKQIQEIDLITNYNYYINVYKLHAIWKEYRILKDKELFNQFNGQRDLEEAIKDKLCPDFIKAQDCKKINKNEDSDKIKKIYKHTINFEFKNKLKVLK